MSDRIGIRGARSSSTRGSAFSADLSVARLSLTNFRCYAQLRLEVGPGPIVLTGPNGAGKTNLLEALSFLSPGRGLRRARLADPDRRKHDGTTVGRWAVAAVLSTAEGPLVRASDGALYGVTVAGGSANQGTVFRFDSATERLRILHAFSSPAGGSHPFGGLVPAGGALYGVTARGPGGTGANAGGGTIFRVDVATGVEGEGHRKDPKLLAAFVAAVRKAEHG